MTDDSRVANRTPAASPRPATLLKKPLALLGGLSPDAFMRDYWQKKPLLIRQAAPEYAGRFPVDDLFYLAQGDDVESRLVRRRRGRWSLEHGPFDPAQRDTLGARDWSLLVQGVNLHDNDGAALLDRFRFIPSARLDDLMVSYAVAGGGVGPHFDSYDVFLLQTQGKRRWRISTQSDLTLDSRQPMKILQHFEATAEWVLEPGDMLYLPPHVAHDGVALDDCVTCSIGFRAPGERELAAQCLQAMAERLSEQHGPDHLYQDPEQTAVTHSAALPANLLATTRRLIDALQWRDADIAAFVGRYLTEPKATVFFDPPRRRLKRESFFARMMACGLHVDKRSQMLYADRVLFINGESLQMDRAKDRKILTRLADRRCLGQRDFVTLSHQSAVVSVLYEWYLAGWIRFV